MIDFQSPAIVRSSSHRPCHSPSPWGEGRDEGEPNLRERSERHFLCCSLVGELNRAGGHWWTLIHLCALASLRLNPHACPKLPKATQACPSYSPREGGEHHVSVASCSKNSQPFARLCQPVPACARPRGGRGVWTLPTLCRAARGRYLGG